MTARARALTATTTAEANRPSRMGTRASPSAAVLLAGIGGRRSTPVTACVVTADTLLDLTGKGDQHRTPKCRLGGGLKTAAMRRAPAESRRGFPYRTEGRQTALPAPRPDRRGATPGDAGEGKHILGLTELTHQQQHDRDDEPGTPGAGEPHEATGGDAGTNLRTECPHTFPPLLASQRPDLTTGVGELVTAADEPDLGELQPVFDGPGWVRCRKVLAVVVAGRHGGHCVPSGVPARRPQALQPGGGPRAFASVRNNSRAGSPL